MDEHCDSQYVLESYGASHKRFYCIKSTEDHCETREENLQYQSLTRFFVTAFLPHGFPDSVSKDYLQYQLWDSIQAFASSITGSLCTHAILTGVGVGDESASPIAATITWLLKDGVSMVGRIGFTWYQGTKLDSDCKRWRLFADLLNDIAMLFDLMSGYFHHHFMIIICMSGLMKSLVGVTGGCTRAALTQHQARNNNMADVSAKDGSQETLVNLLALLCSLVILPIVTKSVVFTWILYSFMTSIHLIANYLAVRSVIMETFNEARFELFTSYYLSVRRKEHLLSVLDVNRQESLFFSLFLETVQVKLGSSFKNIIYGRRSTEVKKLLRLYSDTNYLLRVYRCSSSKVVIYVTFNQRPTALTQMEAYYQACYVKHLLKKDTKLILDDYEFESNLESSSRNYTRTTFNTFKRSLEEMKFNTNNVIFNMDLWRADWSSGMDIRND